MRSTSRVLAVTAILLLSLLFVSHVAANRHNKGDSEAAPASESDHDHSEDEHSDEDEHSNEEEGHSDHDHGDEDEDEDDHGSHLFEYIGQAELPEDTYTMQFSKIDNAYADEQMTVLFMKVDADWEDHLEELEEQAELLLATATNIVCVHEDEHDDHDDHSDEDHEDHSDEDHDDEEHDDEEEHDDDEEHDDEEEHSDDDCGNSTLSNSTNSSSHNCSHSDDDHSDHDDEEEPLHPLCKEQGAEVELNLTNGSTLFIVAFDQGAPFTLIKVRVGEGYTAADHDHDGHDHGDDDHDDDEDEDHDDEEHDEEEDDHDHGRRRHGRQSRGRRYLGRKLLQVSGDTFLVFFQHAPFEFQNGHPWLLNSAGEEPELEDVEGGYQCSTSGLTIDGKWLFSLVGSLCGSAISLVGIFLVLPFVKDQMVFMLPFLRSLAVGLASFIMWWHAAAGIADGAVGVQCGVLLSLVIIHLIPESLALTGAGLEWRAMTCVIGGFAAALWLAHLLELCAYRQVAPEPEGEESSKDEEEEEDEEKPKGPAKALEAIDDSDEETAEDTRDAAEVKMDLILERLDLLAKNGAPASPALVEANWDAEAAMEGQHWMDGRPGAMTSPELKALMAHILIGDFFHNFFDGIIISIAFALCGRTMGWTVVLSVIIHEVPQEISDFLILCQAGLPWHKALFANFCSSLSAILGVFIILPIVIAQGTITRHIEYASGLIVGVSSGVLLYVAIELIPPIIKVRSWKQAIGCWLFFAIGASALGLTLLQHTHCDCVDPSEGASDAHAGHNH